MSTLVNQVIDWAIDRAVDYKMEARQFMRQRLEEDGEPREMLPSILAGAAADEQRDIIIEHYHGDGSERA